MKIRQLSLLDLGTDSTNMVADHITVQQVVHVLVRKFYSMGFFSFLFKILG
jgi:hypothetical protein